MPDYEIKDRTPLGAGPSGSVWKYKNKATSDVVAIKRIDPRTCLDVDAEANVLKLIKKNPHPHLIDIIRAHPQQVGELRYNFIVFPYLTGGTLLDLLLRYGPLTIDYIMSVTRQVTSAIDHMHNVIGHSHGDLKLENILFKDLDRTQIVVCDVGLALPANLDEGTRKTIKIAGTTDYLSYEVWRHGQTGTPQDVWALGIIVYALNTKRFPFKFSSTDQVLRSISQGMNPANATDLERETVSAVLQAERTADAQAKKAIIETLEKGIDWTVFPIDDEYSWARSFIQNCLEIDYGKRWKTGDMLRHEFITNAKDDVKPARLAEQWMVMQGATEFAPPMSVGPESTKASIRRTTGTVSRRSTTQSTHSRHSKSSASARPTQTTVTQPQAAPTESVPATRVDSVSESGIISRSSKMLQSRLAPCDRVNLPSSKSGAPSIVLEDPWKSYNEKLNAQTFRTKMIFFLSVRAGITLTTRGVEFIVNPSMRLLAESGLRFFEGGGARSATASSHSHSRPASPSRSLGRQTIASSVTSGEKGVVTAKSTQVGDIATAQTSHHTKGTSTTSTSHHTAGERPGPPSVMHVPTSSTGSTRGPPPNSLNLPDVPGQVVSPRATAATKSEGKKRESNAPESRKEESVKRESRREPSMKSKHSSHTRGGKEVGDPSRTEPHKSKVDKWMAGVDVPKAASEPPPIVEARGTEPRRPETVPGIVSVPQSEPAKSRKTAGSEHGSRHDSGRSKASSVKPDSRVKPSSRAKDGGKK